MGLRDCGSSPTRWQGDKATRRQGEETRFPDFSFHALATRSSSRGILRGHGRGGSLPHSSSEGLFELDAVGGSSDLNPRPRASTSTGTLHLGLATSPESAMRNHRLFPVAEGTTMTLSLAVGCVPRVGLEFGEPSADPTARRLNAKAPLAERSASQQSCSLVRCV